MTLDPIHVDVVRPGAGGLPEDPLSDDRWTRLLSETEAHRTIGWLVAAVADDRVPVTDEQRAALYGRHEELMHHALVVEDEARGVASILAGRGVQPVVFKGVAAAHLDHPDPALRVFQDVDLLIAPAEVDATVTALTEAGFHRDLPPRRPDWDRRFAKDITMVPPRGGEIDLHRSPVPGPYGFTLDLDEAHARTVSFRLGGADLRALEPPLRVVTAALALTAGEATPRLSASLDLLATVGRHDVGVDDLADVAHRWRVTWLVAEALRWTAGALGRDALPGAMATWSEGVAPTRFDRLVQRAYRSHGGSNTATLLAAPMGMSSVRDRVDYLRGLLRPDASYRQARQRSARPREGRTAIRELLGRK